MTVLIRVKHTKGFSSIDFLYSTNTCIFCFPGASNVPVSCTLHNRDIYKFHFPMVSLQESLPQFSSRKNLFVKLPLTWREEEGGWRVRNMEDDEGRIRKVKGKIESEEAEKGMKRNLESGYRNAKTKAESGI